MTTPINTVNMINASFALEGNGDYAHCLLAVGIDIGDSDNIEDAINNGTLSETKKEGYEDAIKLYLYQGAVVGVGDKDGVYTYGVGITSEDGRMNFVEVSYDAVHILYTQTTKIQPMIEVSVEEMSTPEDLFMIAVANRMTPLFDSKGEGILPVKNRVGSTRKRTAGEAMKYITNTLYDSDPNSIQTDAVTKISNMKDGEVLIVDTPPGSGKTAIAMAPVLLNKYVKNEEKKIVVICTSLVNVSAQISKQLMILSPTTKDVIKVRRCDGGVVQDLHKTINFSSNVFRNWCIEDKYMIKRLGGLDVMHKVAGDVLREEGGFGSIENYAREALDIMQNRRNLYKKMFKLEKVLGKCDVLVGTFESVLYTLANALNKEDGGDSVSYLVIDEWDELGDIPEWSRQSRFNNMYALMALSIVMRRRFNTKVILTSATAKNMYEGSVNADLSIHFNIFGDKPDKIIVKDKVGRQKLQMIGTSKIIDIVIIEMSRVMSDSYPDKFNVVLKVPYMKGEMFVMWRHFFPLSLIKLFDAEGYTVKGELKKPIEVLHSNEAMRPLVLFINSTMVHLSNPRMYMAKSEIVFVQDKVEQLWWMMSMAYMLDSMGLETLNVRDPGYFSEYIKRVKLFCLDEIVNGMFLIGKYVKKMNTTDKYKGYDIRKKMELNRIDTQKEMEALQGLTRNDSIKDNFAENGLEYLIVRAVLYGIIPYNAETSGSNVLSMFIESEYHPLVILTTSRLGAGVDIVTAGPTYVLPAGTMKQSIKNITQWLGRGFRNSNISICLNVNGTPEEKISHTFVSEENLVDKFTDTYTRAISSEAFSRIRDGNLLLNPYLTDMTGIAPKKLLDIKPTVVTIYKINDVFDAGKFLEMSKNNMISVTIHTNSKPYRMDTEDSEVARRMIHTSLGYNSFMFSSLIIPTVYIGRYIRKIRSAPGGNVDMKIGDSGRIQICAINLSATASNTKRSNINIRSYNFDMFINNIPINKGLFSFHELYTEYMTSGFNLVVMLVVLGYAASSSPPTMFSKTMTESIYTKISQCIASVATGMDLSATLGMMMQCIYKPAKGKVKDAKTVLPMEGILNHLKGIVVTAVGQKGELGFEHKGEISLETVTSHVYSIMSSLTASYKVDELYCIIVHGKSSTAIQEMSVIVDGCGVLNNIDSLSELERSNALLDFSPWVNFMFTLSKKFKSSISPKRDKSVVREPYATEEFVSMVKEMMNYIGIPMNYTRRQNKQ